MNSGFHQASRLRRYQIQGAQFLKNSEAALLADEMGLGKTVQTAVALALCDKRIRRILLVVPSSLCLNWYRELKRWAPDLIVRRVIGDPEDRLATYRLPIRVLVASYEQIRSDVLNFRSDIVFDLVVLDEAQRIKNAASATSLACRLLPRKRGWALSGTPLENHPDDIASIFRFLKPGLIHAGMPSDEIHKNMASYFLRRTKSEVLPDLPPINVQNIPLELANEQRQAYDRVWMSRVVSNQSGDDSGASAQMLAVITRLKQICNFDYQSGKSVKLDALRLVLDSVILSGEKILIFSQYVETLQWIQNRIEIPNRIFHGGLSQDQRDAVISEFRQSDEARALLLSTRAAGVGLNLQEASTVVLFDQWWNPATEEQAIQRAHRFGRIKPLQVIRLVIENSIEDRIAEILVEKRELFEQYVEGTAGMDVFDPGELELKRILGDWLRSPRPTKQGTIKEV